jgi:hypothetical protein
VLELQSYSSKESWLSWEDLTTTGRIIFCEICDALRNTDLVIANITTLNFNVLFELGFAMGLGKPVLPVRDTMYDKDKQLFEQLGIFDVLGYEDFQNSVQLRQVVTRCQHIEPLKLSLQPINKEQPTYVIRSPHDNDGNIRLFSALKKSALYRFRSFDSRETPRLSLYEAHKQVCSSVAVVTHLVDPNLKDAPVHNALCAFVGGMAMAMGKHVLMLQEGYTIQPIDYREVVVHYQDVETIAKTVERFVRAVADTLLYVSTDRTAPPRGLLEQIDLGDIAAENEIRSLDRYLVKTPQFQQARNGHARLVVGRKGAGKTAIFYAVRNDLFRSNKNATILDLKPDGHHFTKLRETVLQHLSEGVQLHTLTSFWHYLLLLELAQKLIDREASTAWRDPESLKAYDALKQEYAKHSHDNEGDFSERIMGLVTRIIDSYPSELKGALKTPDITKMIYQRDVNELTKLVIGQLQKKEEVWILFDNIDKGWSLRGATEADIAVVRSLLDATRKLQQQLIARSVDCKTIVFLRKDICDLLIEQTPDRGKESVAQVEWTDEVLLEELLRKRFASTPALKGDFRSIWTQVCEAHVGGEDSFRYILARCFSQPRAVLNFVTKCIQTAVSRDHNRVLEDDILTAEKGFSEDVANGLRLEIRDVFPKYPDLLHVFVGQEKVLSQDDIDLALTAASINTDNITEIIDVLLWFSFIGVKCDDDVRYSYQVSYDLKRLKTHLQGYQTSAKTFVVHPAFYQALELK